MSDYPRTSVRVCLSIKGEPNSQGTQRQVLIFGLGTYYDNTQVEEYYINFAFIFYFIIKQKMFLGFYFLYDIIYIKEKEYIFVFYMVYGK